MQLFIAIANSRKEEITFRDCRRRWCRSRPRPRLGFDSTQTAHTYSRSAHIRLFVVFIYLFTFIVDDDEDDDDDIAFSSIELYWSCCCCTLPWCAPLDTISNFFPFSSQDLASRNTRAFQLKQFQFAENCKCERNEPLKCSDWSLSLFVRVCSLPTLLLAAVSRYGQNEESCSNVCNGAFSAVQRLTFDWISFLHIFLSSSVCLHKCGVCGVAARRFRKLCRKPWMPFALNIYCSRRGNHNAVPLGDMSMGEIHFTEYSHIIELHVNSNFYATPPQ